MLYNETIMLKSEEKQHERQEKIIELIKEKGAVSNAQILAFLNKRLETEISRATVNRDLEKLLKQNLLVKKGKGRSVVYDLQTSFYLLQTVDIGQYFSQEADIRQVKEKFNFDIFSALHNLFTQSEKEHLIDLKTKYQKKIKSLSKTLIEKDFERLAIELSWKSSKIEGNTYSLLETEFLITENIEAAGHTKEEAIMILNHKKAFDFIRHNSEKFKSLSVCKIEDVHSLIAKDLGISKNLRKRIVRITGTKYQPLDNSYQIEEALKKTCQIVNKETDPFGKAFIVLAMIAYIQPFEDGNKRTARLMANAVLAAHDICPLSFGGLDVMEYKKAMLLFYEQNNLSYLKPLFIEQFEFAVKNYFG